MRSQRRRSEWWLRADSQTSVKTQPAGVRSVQTGLRAGVAGGRGLPGDPIGAAVAFAGAATVIASSNSPSHGSGGGSLR